MKHGYHFSQLETAQWVWKTFKDRQDLKENKSVQEWLETAYNIIKAHELNL